MRSLRRLLSEGGGSKRNGRRSTSRRRKSEEEEKEVEGEKKEKKREGEREKKEETEAEEAERRLDDFLLRGRLSSLERVKKYLEGLDGPPKSESNPSQMSDFDAYLEHKKRSLSRNQEPMKKKRGVLDEAVKSLKRNTKTAPPSESSLLARAVSLEDLECQGSNGLLPHLSPHGSRSKRASSLKPPGGGGEGGESGGEESWKRERRPRTKKGGVFDSLKKDEDSEEGGSLGENNSDAWSGGSSGDGGMSAADESLSVSERIRRKSFYSRFNPPVLPPPFPLPRSTSSFLLSARTGGRILPPGFLFPDRRSPSLLSYSRSLSSNSYDLKGGVLPPQPRRSSKSSTRRLPGLLITE